MRQIPGRGEHFRIPGVVQPSPDIVPSLEQTEIAVKHARSARRKRWICFGICVFVVAVLALVLGLYFGLHKTTSG